MNLKEEVGLHSVLLPADKLIRRENIWDGVMRLQGMQFTEFLESKKLRQSTRDLKHSQAKLKPIPKA